MVKKERISNTISENASENASENEYASPEASLNNSENENENENENQNENKTKIIINTKKTTKSYDDLILDLKIIAKIKPFNKLIVSFNKLFIDESYYFSSFIRYLNNQNRNQGILYIESINVELEKHINKIIEHKNLDKNILQDNPSSILVNLSHDLTLATKGLKNLILSYCSDNYIVSKIEIIISNFELKIKKISEILLI